MGIEPNSQATGYLRSYPGALILVMEHLGIDPIGRFRLSAHDFVDRVWDAGLQESPVQFYAISTGEWQPLDRPDIRYVHRSGQGWYWYTSEPAQYPATPFLLTGDPTYRLDHRGRIALAPVERMARLIRGQCHFDGVYDIPIVTDGWLGMVRVVDPDTDHAQLWTISKQDLTLSGRIDNLRCADLDDGDEFGAIVIPPDA